MFDRDSTSTGTSGVCPGTWRKQARPFQVDVTRRRLSQRDIDDDRVPADNLGTGSASRRCSRDAHGRPFVAGVTATPLLSEQDVADLAETIEPGSSAAVVAWKNPQPHRRSLLLRQQLPAVRQHHHQRCVHPRPANPTRRRHRVTRRRRSPRLGHRGRSPTPASSAASPVNSNDPRTATYPTQRLTPHRGLNGDLLRDHHPTRPSAAALSPR